jgi:hypothetical protein
VSTPPTPNVPAIVPMRSQPSARGGAREGDGALGGNVADEDGDASTGAGTDGLATADALDAGPASLDALPAALELDGLACPPHPSTVTTAATANSRARPGIPIVIVT